MGDAFSLSCRTVSAQETFALGKALGSVLGGPLPGGGPLLLAGGAGGAPARVLLLLGELGSGKTTFTKGLAGGLGVRDLDRVTSPTFVLRQEYQGRFSIRHYDAYRLGGPGELIDLGFEEDLERGGLVVVEWADRVEAAITAEALTVDFAHDPPGIPGTSPGDAGRRLLTLRGSAAFWKKPVEEALAAARPSLLHA